MSFIPSILGRAEGRGEIFGCLALVVSTWYILSVRPETAVQTSAVFVNRRSF